MEDRANLADTVVRYSYNAASVRCGGRGPADFQPLLVSEPFQPGLGRVVVLEIDHCLAACSKCSTLAC